MMNWMIYSDRGGDYMRLIDANELEKVMKEDWFLDILLTQTGKSDMAKKLVDMIDSVPLAYDVEKVVEELERQAEQERNRGFEFEQKGYSAMADKYYGKYCSYEYATEIVRKGGVE